MPKGEDIGGSFLRGLSTFGRTFAAGKIQQAQDKQKLADETRRKREKSQEDYDVQIDFLKFRAGKGDKHAGFLLENLEEFNEGRDIKRALNKEELKAISGDFSVEQDEHAEFLEGLRQLTGAPEGSEGILGDIAQQEGIAPGSLATPGGQRATAESLIDFTKFLPADASGQFDPAIADRMRGPALEGITEQVGQLRLDELVARSRTKAIAGAEGIKEMERRLFASDVPELRRGRRGREGVGTKPPATEFTPKELKTKYSSYRNGITKSNEAIRKKNAENQRQRDNMLAGQKNISAEDRATVERLTPIEQEKSPLSFTEWKKQFRTQFEEEQKQTREQFRRDAVEASTEVLLQQLTGE